MDFRVKYCANHYQSLPIRLLVYENIYRDILIKNVLHLNFSSYRDFCEKGAWRRPFGISKNATAYFFTHPLKITSSDGYQHKSSVKKVCTRFSPVPKIPPDYNGSQHQHNSDTYPSTGVSPLCLSIGFNQPVGCQSVSINRCWLSIGWRIRIGVGGVLVLYRTGFAVLILIRYGANVEFKYYTMGI